MKKHPKCLPVKTAVEQRGGASVLASELGVTAPLIYQWIAGDLRVPAERCLKIARLTGGEVRCEDLRPDLDWDAVLLQPSKQAA